MGGNPSPASDPFTAVADEHPDPLRYRLACGANIPTGASMTLRLVSPGAPLPEAEEKVHRRELTESACEAIRACVAAGGEFWALTMQPDGEMHVSYVGDGLDVACTAEEVARRMRLAEIGFPVE